MSRNLHVPVDDTYLDCNDSEGTGYPVILLNGAFGTQKDWNNTIAHLDGRYRVVTYDERARGKSGRSKDYSFAGTLADLGAIIKATGVERPILVGWSYGAATSVRYAAEHPDQVAGIVVVDGAYPVVMLTEQDKARVRKTFKRLAPLMWVLARLGRSARMSAAEAAETNIELNEVCGTLGPDYDRLQCPVAFLAATKAHIGSTQEQVDRMRASLTPLIEQHPNIRLAATVPSSHAQLPFQHGDLIAATVADMNTEVHRPELRL
jgi:pimeloyl-ACP methyl ester carboxylesterase